jgi:E3 ubiquitin-protein ligase SHPRH
MIGDFFVGCLTVCGHNYCKECIIAWWRTHRHCPVCRTKLSVADIYDVAYKTKSISFEEENASADTYVGMKGRKKSGGAIYKDVDNQMLREIEEIPLKTRMGTKIDTSKLPRGSSHIRD